MDAMFPYDREQALTGPARILWAPISAEVPSDLGDIIELVRDEDNAYPPVSPWSDFGLTTDAPNYTRDMDSEGIEYEQETGALFQQITAVNRQATIPIAEITPEHLQIIENSASVEDIPGGADVSAQSKVSYGQFSESELYRIAIISRRPKTDSVVEEPDGYTRSSLVANVLYRVSLAAESAEYEPGRGDGVGIPVVFAAQGEPDLEAGAEVGCWLFEEYGLVSAT